MKAKKIIVIKIQFLILIFSLICFHNSDAAPIAGSPEDPAESLPACPEGQHRVDEVCCPLSMDYVVSGFCSSCPEGQVICGGGCVSTCPSNKTLDSNTCGCVCTSSCSAADQTQDLSTCACNCSVGQEVCGGACVNSCPSGKTLDPATCTCKCSSTTCGVLYQVQDPTTCACSCPSGQIVQGSTGPACKDNCAVLGINTTMDSGLDGFANLRAEFDTTVNNNCLINLLKTLSNPYSPTTTSINSTREAYGFTDYSDRLADDKLLKQLWITLLQNSGIPTDDYLNNRQLISGCTGNLLTSNPTNGHLAIGGGNPGQLGCKQGKIVVDSNCRLVRGNFSNKSNICGASFGGGGFDNTTNLHWSSTTR